MGTVDPLQTREWHNENKRRLTAIEKEMTKVSHASFGYVGDDGVWYDGIVQDVRAMKKAIPVLYFMAVISGISAIHSVGPDTLKTLLELSKLVK